MSEQGKSPGEIRDAIIRGEYKKVSLQ